MNTLQLRKHLDELEQQTLQVTPGPWHRVTTAVMRRTEEIRYGIPLQQMRMDPIPVPDENFWDDVTMTETHFDDGSRKTVGWIGSTEREEDAAHFARCDREMFLWLIEDCRARLNRHTSVFDTTLCIVCATLWPCEEVLTVQQFVTHASLE